MRKQYVYTAMLCMITLLSAACGKKQPIVIQYEEPSLFSQGPTRSFSGKIISIDRHILSLPIHGLVEEMSVATNAPVVEGQILLRLQAQALKQNMIQAQEQVNQAQVQLADRLKEATLAQQMLSAGAGSQAAYDSAAQAYNQMDIQLPLLQKALEAAEQAYNQSALRSPTDGFVDEIMVKPGDYIAANQPLIVVDANNSLRIPIQIPAELASFAANGSAVQVSIEALGSSLFHGLIESHTTQANGDQHLLISVMPQTDLRLNQNATVLLSVQNPANPSWWLSKTMVHQWDQQGQAFVWLYYPEKSLARKQPVRVLAVKETEVHIEGLALGQKVITQAAAPLENGSFVTSFSADALPTANIGRIELDTP